MEHKCMKDDEFKRIWKEIEDAETSNRIVNQAVIDFNEKHLRTTFAIENIQNTQSDAKNAQLEQSMLIKAGFKAIEDKHQLEENEVKATQAATKDYQRRFMMGVWFVGINLFVSTLIGVWRIYIYPWISGT